MVQEYQEIVYLNTSHVKVNPKTQSGTILKEPYLNTSHVKVNQFLPLTGFPFMVFKYISC